MQTLVKNGTIVTATDIFNADIIIHNETISEIGKNLDNGLIENVIDASNKYIFPGGVDVHTHLELPFMGTVSIDDFFTGTKAAICGGTTSIVDFIIPEKGKPLAHAFDSWLRKAEKSVADYGFHMAIPEYTKSVADEIPSIINKGVSSFKCFMAYKNALQIDDAGLIAILQNVGKHGGLVSVHAENGDIIYTLTQEFLAKGKYSPEYHYLSHPEIAEIEAIERAATLAHFTNQPIYIVHLSSAGGLDRIKTALLRGYKVYAETCPQYLLLSSDIYFKPNFEGAKVVMSPPIRPAEQHQKIWQGIADGYIKVVATDHCPFNFVGQKDMGKKDFTKIPNGIGSVGDRFNLLYTYGVGQGRITLNRFVDIIATSPAKIFGMYPQKGSVIVGGDADLVIFDPNAEATISAATKHHNCDYTPFEGFKLKGLPQTVLLRGKIAVKDGVYTGNQGKGNFIKRKSSGNL